MLDLDGLNAMIAQMFHRRAARVRVRIPSAQQRDPMPTRQPDQQVQGTEPIARVRGERQGSADNHDVHARRVP